MSPLRVVTLNLWNNDLFRFERAHLVTQQIAYLQPHLVALQEISVVHDMDLKAGAIHNVLDID